MRVPSLTRAWPLPLSSFCASLFRDATLKNRRITRSIYLKYGAEKCNGLTTYCGRGRREREWERGSETDLHLRQSGFNQIGMRYLKRIRIQICFSCAFHNTMHTHTCIHTYVHIECETWYIDSIPLAFTRTHTHRVTNAPTYTNTHTDTFVAVTRATTFVGFLLNNECGTQIYLNFSWVPHFSSFLMFFIFFLRLVVSFYNGCRRRCDFRLFFSHTLTEPNTHSHSDIWNDPLSQRYKESNY